MSYADPSKLAVLACPGGEAFANEVIVHLKHCYRQKFEKAVTNLVGHHGMTRDAVLRQLTFVHDAANLSTAGAEKFLSPRFKVDARFTLFANGEIKAEILESVRGKCVYIVEDVENRYPLVFYGGVSKSFSVNDHIMSILVTVDAVKQAGAKRITLVLPNYPYSRQHKRKGREGLTASRIGIILESLGVDRLLTLDIHSREISNAFRTMGFESLHASYQIIRELSKMPQIREGNFVVVSPDTGAVDRNKFYANSFKKPLALLYKERDYSRVTKDAGESNIAELRLLGNVKDKTVFMADDILGSGATLLKAMGFLKEQGAQDVIAAISLPLFSGDAMDYFDDAFRQGLFYRIIGTNAVYHEELIKKEWYIPVSVSKLFARTISRLHQELSVSSLLDNRELIEKLLSVEKETKGPSLPEDCYT
ncbi:MAG: ribose-phosphate diphosphokinase [Spirochaetaceae bacterium]|jgi:ribose-phosphate pyrophosphokinase|nr:ribose-phosphate diphosphokinase [Spirochaetaceae bacterium]